MILHHEFVRNAKRFGKKLAINDYTLNRKVTYSKALIGSLILARKFRVREEVFIGIMLPTSAGGYLATVGAVMAGKVPVMINYATGASANCIYAQRKCGFRTIITSKALLEKVNAEFVDGMVFLEDIMKRVSPVDKLRAAFKAMMPASWINRFLPPVEEDDTVVILFTSGSEKEPKAVQLTHRNIGSNVRGAAEVLGLTTDDIGMCCLPIFHSFGQMSNFWLVLTLGITGVTYANPLDYKTIPKIIRAEKTTLIGGTPIFLAGYLKESQPGDFDSLRRIIAGADKCPGWVRDGYRKKHGKEVLEGYGCTETSPVISLNTMAENRPGSVGKPLPGTRIRIMDLLHEKELAPGEQGKILVKGDLVMKGYLNDVEETALRIHDGWYDTGDMGMWDEDGYLWHKGRLKRFVKIGGEMVSLVRTESMLEAELPAGVDCCVVDIPDSRKGARIIAAVTQKVRERELIKKLARKLPSIAVPKQFVVLAEMPKMGSGKVDFRATASCVREALGL